MRDLVALLDDARDPALRPGGPLDGRSQRAALRRHMARPRECSAGARRCGYRNARIGSGSHHSPSRTRGRRTSTRSFGSPTPSFDLRLLDFVPTYGGDAPRAQAAARDVAGAVVGDAGREEQDQLGAGRAAHRADREGEGGDDPERRTQRLAAQPEAVADELWRFLGPLAATA